MVDLSGMDQYSYKGEDLKQVYIDRIERGPAEFVKLIAKSRVVTDRLWDFDTYLIFAVMAPASVAQFDRFYGRYGTPFPGLIRRDSEKALFSMEGNNSAIEKMTLKIGRNRAISLHADASFRLSELGIKCEVMSRPIHYSIDLAFIIKFGETNLRFMAADILEELILNYIAHASDYKIAYV